MIVRIVSTARAAALFGMLFVSTQAHAAAFTVDLTTQGTLAANSYSSAVLSLGSVSIAAGGTLQVDIDFLGNQVLKLTDLNGVAPPQEQFATLRYGGTALGASTAIASVSLLILDLSSASLQPNPDTATCTTNAGGTACNTSGLGDLTAGTISFSGFQAVLTNTSGASKTFTDFSFQIVGEEVSVDTAAAAVPEPAGLAILGLALAALGLAKRNRAH